MTVCSIVWQRGSPALGISALALERGSSDRLQVLWCRSSPGYYWGTMAHYLHQQGRQLALFTLCGCNILPQTAWL